ncbi:MAG: porin family protein [Cyclobacteriaceae bacterium]
MKKIMFLAIMLYSTQVVLAQVSGGIKGGINLTNQKWEVEFQGDSDSEKYNGTGFHIGGYLTKSLSDVVTLQPELMFNVLKADVEDEDFTMNYISLPIMLGYGVENNKLILQAGPQLGVLLSTDPEEMKEDDAIKAIDFSFNFGGTINFDKLNLSVRYSLGLANLTGDALIDELEAFLGEDIDLKIKNNNLQLSVGYKLFGK